MRRLGCAVALLAAAALAGCELGPTLTPEQWAAIETREIDGQREDVLRAAASVVLDEGYFYRASDHEAGILTGERVPAEAEDTFRRRGGMGSGHPASSIAVWVRPGAGDRCELRLQRYAMLDHQGHRHHIADAEGASRFAAAVERRMLGGEAVPIRGGAAPARGRMTP